MFLTTGGAMLDLRGSCADALAPAAGAPDLAHPATTGTAQPTAMASSALPGAALPSGAAPQPQACAPGGAVLRFHPTNGATAAPGLMGQDQLPGVVNYLIGNDPTQWRTNVPTYARVAYQGVYPGIDLVYYGNQGRLEEDYVVAPGADVSRIHIAVDGAQGLSLDAGGNLVLQTAVGALTETSPVIHQQVNGQRREVSGHYIRLGAQTLGFAVGRYDTSQPLVIDPVLVYSTYLGGSGTEAGQGIAVDGQGAVYVTGSVTSTDFPTTTGSYSATLQGSKDAFVTKLNAQGSARLYSTYLGGSTGGITGTTGTGIAVDGAGNAFLTGGTTATDFPTRNAYQSVLNKGSCHPPLCGDAFVTELNSTGANLLYSTFLGGAFNDQGNAIALDSGGNAYVTGFTQSGFPLVHPLQSANQGGQHAFVTKITPTLSGVASVVYSTYLGGTGRDVGNGIAVDSAGDMYVTGATTSMDFLTTTNALYTQNDGQGGPEPGSSDAFLTELNPTGQSALYSTYLGGVNDDYGAAIALDHTGNVYVTGKTNSPAFPVKNAFEPVAPSLSVAGLYVSTFVAFVSAISPTLSGAASLLYSTYFGGGYYGDGTTGQVPGNDAGTGIAVDGAGNIHVAGVTGDSNLPLANWLQGSLNMDPVYTGYRAYQTDAFVAVLSPHWGLGRRGLLFASYLGGSGADAGAALALDGAGNEYVTGATSSANLLTTTGAYSGTLAGGQDAFVAKITPAPPAIPVSIGVVQGSFYSVTVDSGAFITPTYTPLFTESFPLINFNGWVPGAHSACGNSASAGYQWNSAPMLDIVPLADGSCAAQTVAGNGFQAGVNFPNGGGAPATSFEAVYTSTLTVASAGVVTLTVNADDGWILALGPDAAGHQPTQLAGSSNQTPATGALTGYPVVGGNNG